MASRNARVSLCSVSKWFEGSWFQLCAVSMRLLIAMQCELQLKVAEKFLKNPPPPPLINILCLQGVHLARLDLTATTVSGATVPQRHTFAAANEILSICVCLW